MQFHPKVTAGVVAGAVTSILVSELARHGIQLAGDEAAGITTLLSFVAAFFMPADDAPAAPPAPSVILPPQ